MALREQELAERKLDIEFSAKKCQIDLEKKPEENRKRPIQAEMQAIDPMDSESLFSKADKELRRGSYHSIRNDDLVNKWLESADNKNTLTATDKTVQTSCDQNQERQTKSGQNQEPSSDPAQAVDRDSQSPPLIQQSPFKVNETGLENGKLQSRFPDRTN